MCNNSVYESEICKYVYECFSLTLWLQLTVASEDPQDTIVMSQGTFSWQGPGGPDHPTEGDTGSETESTKGSLLLHSLNLTITKVCTLHHKLCNLYSV